MADLLFDSSWLGPLLWAAVYISDYRMTLMCARMYQAQQAIVFEGSYEITPLFQADVNALRRLSPRFVIALVASTAWLAVVQHTSSAPGSSSLYAGVLGALLLLQAAVHLRHFRNWFLFRNVKAVQGRVFYPRALMLQASAIELVGFSALYLTLFLLTASTFILGGAIACGVLVLNHYRLVQRHLASTSTPAVSTRVDATPGH
jgi:hypothetical protein